MIKFPLLAILFFIAASVFAQTEKETKDLLCHKWKLTHMKESDGEKTPVPEELETLLEIRLDGTMTSTGLGKHEKGKWSYDHKTKTITTEVKARVAKWEVINVTENELILKSGVKEMSMTLIWKKVN